MRKHLAIFSPEGAEQILSGTKTVETRFSKNKIVPFGEVSVGDIVYMKVSGGDIIGQFLVKKVISIENIEQSDWDFMRKSYGKQISLGSQELDEKFFNEKKESRFGTLLFIYRVEQFIVPPIKITKRDQRGWMVIE